MKSIKEYIIESFSRNIKKDIFTYISYINPSKESISSIGDYVSHSSQTVADSVLKEVIKAINDKYSLAYKIASSNRSNFTDKQLWVLTFELEKNKEFSEHVKKYYDDLDKKQKDKIDASKAKLKANKDASADILSQIKTNGKLLKDYYSWLKVSKYKKEFFSKKYSQDSVTDFLNT